MAEPPPTGDPTVDATWDAVCEFRRDRRAVVVLRCWADLAPDEIAEVLDSPVAGVRTRLRRALADGRGGTRTTGTDDTPDGREQAIVRALAAKADQLAVDPPSCPSPDTEPHDGGSPGGGGADGGGDGGGSDGTDRTHGRAATVIRLTPPRPSRRRVLALVVAGLVAAGAGVILADRVGAEVGAHVRAHPAPHQGNGTEEPGTDAGRAPPTRQH